MTKSNIEWVTYVFMYLQTPNAALQTGYFRACMVTDIAGNKHSNSVTYFQFQIPHFVCFYTAVD